MSWSRAQRTAATYVHLGEKPCVHGQEECIFFTLSPIWLKYLYCCCSVASMSILWQATCMLIILPHPCRWKSIAASVRVMTGLVMPLCPAEQSLANCWWSQLCGRSTGTSDMHLASLSPKPPWRPRVCISSSFLKAFVPWVTLFTLFCVGLW